MVVLEDHHVEQPDAVVAAAADADGHLVQHAHARRGFARVDHLCFEPVQFLDVNGRLRRYAAHPLHDVQQDAFGLQQ